MPETLFAKDNKTPIFSTPRRLSADALCVRYTMDQVEAIEELAAKYGVGKATAARWLVEFAIQNANVS